MKNANFLWLMFFVLLVFFIAFMLTNTPSNKFYVDDYKYPFDKDDGPSITRVIKEAEKNGGGIVVFSDKQYITSLTKEELPSNITLLGSGSSSQIKATVTGVLFKSSGKKNIRIKGLSFSGNNNDGLVYEGDTIDGIIIEDCDVENIRLFRSTLPAGIEYATMEEKFLNRNIQILNNKGIGFDKNTSGAFIDLRYAKDVIAKGNNIKKYRHGIEWWGGDANPSKNGVFTNPRWAINISISNNTVDDIGLGGIWGSMGTNISIINKNSVTNCGDVGIDFEGTFSSKATGNYVKNCKNGGLTTFFFNKDIIFDNNVVESDVDQQYLFKVFNSSNSNNNSIKVINNTFNHTGSGIGYVGGEQVESLLFSKNKLKNTAINFYSLNYKNIEISYTELSFTNLYNKAFNAVYLQRLIGNSQINISNIKIVSDVIQPPGSRGMYIILNDYNSLTKAFIENNEVTGFPIDVEVRADSANPGIVPEFFVRNNLMSSRNFIFSKGETQKGKLFFDGNYDNNKFIYNFAN